MIIALDVDTPTLDLMTVWLSLYNTDWSDNLTVDKIVDWDLHQFVKPECGTKIYNYLKDPDLYWAVEPIEGAFAGVKKLREMGHRVIFCTDTTTEQAGKKYTKLKELGFIDRKEDYIECRDKSLINADILLDDGFHNVKAFHGISFLFDAPWNRKYDFDLRVYGWEDFINLLSKGLGKEAVE
jgi:5'-nucleotidase